MRRGFVVHSLRHHVAGFDLPGVDASTTVKIAGHRSIAISRRYVHPSPESLFEKLEASNHATPRNG